VRCRVRVRRRPGARSRVITIGVIYWSESVDYRYQDVAVAEGFRLGFGATVASKAVPFQIGECGSEGPIRIDSVENVGPIESDRLVPGVVATVSFRAIRVAQPARIADFSVIEMGVTAVAPSDVDVVIFVAMDDPSPALATVVIGTGSGVAPIVELSDTGLLVRHQDTTRIAFVD
jgi:hypothetical protein